MSDNKDKSVAAEQSKNKNDEQELNVHNPLKKDDDTQVTQDDVNNEQAFKEAQTERD